MKRLIITLFILLISYPQNGNAILYSFCFDKNVSLRNAHYKLKDILLRSDKVFYRESKNCLEIELSSDRKELFEIYIYKHIGRVRVTSDQVGGLGNINVNKTCKIQVIKNRNAKGNSKDYALGKGIKLRYGESKRESNTTMEMVVTQGLKATIKMDKEEAEIKCRELGTGHFQIKVFVTNDNNGKQSTLSTNILVNQGTPFEIGSIIENLKNKDQEISTKVGFEKNKKKLKSNIQYFILVK